MLYIKYKCENCEKEYYKLILLLIINFYIFTYFYRFYKTLSLWLEEPRLHEPGLYLPALPPQYMSQKLVLLVQDNWVSFNLLYLL